MSKRIRVCLIGLAVCLTFATIWALLAVPGTALAAKGGKKGGGGGNDPVCLTFPDYVGGNGIAGVQSDGLGDYCNNKKGKVEAIMNENGGVRLVANTSQNDPEAGRDLFVDFGREIHLIANPDVTFQTTDDLADLGFISRRESFKLFGVDLRAMAVDQTRTDARLHIRVALRDREEDLRHTLFIYFDPEQNAQRACTGSGSTEVTVTRKSDTEWIVTNVDENGNLSEAGLAEGFRIGVSTEGFWCRTDDGEDLLVLPPFTVTVKLQ